MNQSLSRECSMLDPKVVTVLEQLFQKTEANDPAVMHQVQAEVNRLRAENSEAFAAPERADIPVSPERNKRIADLLGEAFIPVPPEVGRWLYILARTHGCKTIVEFGTSFGISTIHLAAAARDNGGKVITTELNSGKVQRARQNLSDAGLLDFVEIRQGDALQTLRDIESPIDLLFLDGWKDLYLPVLKLVEPALRPGALVVADDLDLFPEVHKPYLEYVRNVQNGYLSVELPVGDKLEISLRC